MSAPHKIRIDFRIKDVDASDEPTTGDRFVVFGDEIDPQGIRDFFDKCHDAVIMLYGSRKKAVEKTNITVSGGYAGPISPEMSEFDFLKYIEKKLK